LAGISLLPREHKGRSECDDNLAIYIGLFERVRKISIQMVCVEMDKHIARSAFVIYGRGKVCMVKKKLILRIFLSLSHSCHILDPASPLPEAISIPGGAVAPRRAAT
jgi:hypothetical protein